MKGAIHPCSVYCWRVGGACDIDARGVCPECGWRWKPPIQRPLGEYWPDGSEESGE